MRAPSSTSAAVALAARQLYARAPASSSRRPLRRALSGVVGTGSPHHHHQQHRHRHQLLLARAIGTGSSSSSNDNDKDKEGDGWRGTLSGGGIGHPLQPEGDHELRDLAFTASRIGYPAYDESEPHNAALEAAHDATMNEPEDIREESRLEAVDKAERILAILRHSMTELDIGRVIHRISQYATTPRVTPQTRKQFLKSLESRFGPEHQREHALVLAFLEGRDHVIEELQEASRRAMDAALAPGPSASSSTSTSTTPSSAHDAVDREMLVPEIMGLHPELVADPKFIGVVFCYCRMACLNSQKLVRPPHGQHRLAKSSLQQVKHDFRRVLDSEGLAHFAEMMGIKATDPAMPTSAAAAATGTGAHAAATGGGYGTSVLLDGALDGIDAEWDEFNLENDRIDFRMLVAQTEDLIGLMKRELSDETITKMLIAMLASLKTTKLHRKIFQEMVCNIQAALPERSHEAVLASLVPFLSGNQATYEDFESDTASAALLHHRSRHEAILRALLETRMRLGHILIHDLDAIDPMASISHKLSPEVRDKVITAAWNIVSVLNDREYHVFFSRFLKHKLAWRPSRATFGQTFLDDVRKTLGPRQAEAIMPLFEEVFPHLSVETLTICRVKLRHSRGLLRERATLRALGPAGHERLASTWDPARSVFYRNLPHGVTEKHLRAALDHIGKVKRFVFFSNPKNGAPDELDDGEDAEAEAAEDEDEEDDDAVVVDEDDDVDDDDDDLDDDVDDVGELDEEAKARRKAEAAERRRQKKLLTQGSKTPKKKAYVIASDKKSAYNVVVEFESEHGRDRALQRALQIFGVMMGGWKEFRPVFSSDAASRTTISLQSIPFGTSLALLVHEVNGILAREGLELDLASQIPRGVLVTNGRLELRFDSFAEAAQVVDLVHAHVSQMKSRRELAGEDLYLEMARELRQERLDKGLSASPTRKSKKKKTPTTKVTPSGGGDVEDVEDELVSFDGVDDEPTAAAATEEENEDAYFAAVEEDAGRHPPSPEELALRALPRPFEVTWNPPPRAKNKHMYV